MAYAEHDWKARANGRASVDAAAIAKAHAVYAPLSLRFYDLVVRGLSNRFAWACPTRKIIELYARSPSANHLEVGVGMGLFLDRARTVFDWLALRHLQLC